MKHQIENQIETGIPRGLYRELPFKKRFGVVEGSDVGAIWGCVFGAFHIVVPKP